MERKNVRENATDEGDWKRDYLDKRAENEKLTFPERAKKNKKKTKKRCRSREIRPTAKFLHPLHTHTNTHTHPFLLLYSPPH